MYIYTDNNLSVGVSKYLENQLGKDSINNVYSGSFQGLPSGSYVVKLSEPIHKPELENKLSAMNINIRDIKYESDENGVSKIGIPGDAFDYKTKNQIGILQRLDDMNARGLVTNRIKQGINENYISEVGTDFLKKIFGDKISRFLLTQGQSNNPTFKFTFDPKNPVTEQDLNDKGFNVHHTNLPKATVDNENIVTIPLTSFSHDHVTQLKHSQQLLFLKEFNIQEADLGHYRDVTSNLVEYGLDITAREKHAANRWPHEYISCIAENLTIAKNMINNEQEYDSVINHMRDESVTRVYYTSKGNFQSDGTAAHMMSRRGAFPDTYQKFQRMCDAFKEPMQQHYWKKIDYQARALANATGLNENYTAHDMEFGRNLSCLQKNVTNEEQYQKLVKEIQTSGDKYGNSVVKYNLPENFSQLQQQFKIHNKEISAYNQKYGKTKSGAELVGVTKEAITRLNNLNK